MTSNLWAAAATAIAGLLFAALEGLKLLDARRTGAALEAGKVVAVTAKVETAIAQAEASAPATDAAVIDRAEQGTF